MVDKINQFVEAPLVLHIEYLARGGSFLGEETKWPNIGGCVGP
jgi:hypothetical protein